MQIQTAEDFSQAVRNFLKNKNFSYGQLAKIIQRPRTTILTWASKGIKEKSRRDRVVEQYPAIFSDGDLELAPAVVTEPVQEKVKKQSFSDIQVLMKIELGRQGIVLVSDILQWFINASAEERNRFREELGSLWKNFLELTRAMTGERALELALQERRVRSGNDHD